MGASRRLFGAPGVAGGEIRPRRYASGNTNGSIVGDLRFVPYRLGHVVATGQPVYAVFSFLSFFVLSFESGRSRAEPSRVASVSRPSVDILHSRGRVVAKRMEEYLGTRIHRHRHRKKSLVGVIVGGGATISVLCAVAGGERRAADGLCLQLFFSDSGRVAVDKPTSASHTSLFLFLSCYSPLTSFLGRYIIAHTRPFGIVRFPRLLRR